MEVGPHLVPNFPLNCTLLFCSLDRRRKPTLERISSLRGFVWDFFSRLNRFALMCCEIVISVTGG